MTDQISGFVQFFQNLLGTAPPQLRAVPQRGAPIDEIRDFVDSPFASGPVRATDGWSSERFCEPFSTPQY